MADEKDARSPSNATLKREQAYRTANRLITSAGLTLALVGVRRNAAEMEALRRAL